MTHQPHGMTPAEMAVDETASARAPVIFFDGVPNFGLNNGVLNLTLETLTFSAANGDVTPRRVTVAHLRTSIAALGQLKAALEGLELLSRQPYQGANN